MKEIIGVLVGVLILYWLFLLASGVMGGSCGAGNHWQSDAYDIQGGCVPD